MKRYSIDKKVIIKSLGVFNLSSGSNKIEFYQYQNVKKGSIIGLELSQASLAIQLSPLILSDYIVRGNRIYKLSYEQNLALRFKASVKDYFYSTVVIFKSEISTSAIFSAKFEAHNETKSLVVKNEKSYFYYNFNIQFNLKKNFIKESLVIFTVKVQLISF